MKRFPTLFCRATTGKIKVWEVFAEEDGTYTTSAGYIYGTMTPHTTYCNPKNIGRANETTAAEQAEKEALAKWEKQHKKGYRESIEESDNAPKRPTLCQDYKDVGHNMEYPAETGPKLNGMRVMSVRSLNTGVYKGLSRELNPVQVPTHIQHELQLMHHLPNTIDGEFYIHGMHLQDIISLVKRPLDKAGNLRKDVLKLQYRLFDLPHNTMISNTRMKKLAALAAACSHMDLKSVLFVPSYPVESEEAMFRYRDRFVKEGYEGSVTRTCEGKYIWGAKTKTMMKSKPFQDAEFKIVDIEPDKDGLAMAVCVTKKGQHFGASFEGKSDFRSNTEYRAFIINNPKLFIGQQATVRFQDYSRDDIPTIGNTIQAIRNYE
jgi:ATP-dependent DNA ligase